MPRPHTFTRTKFKQGTIPRKCLNDDGWRRETKSSVDSSDRFDCRSVPLRSVERVYIMESSSKQSTEDTSKWVRVKVNNEYYELNESISDQSSSDEEDEKKMGKVEVDESAISIASSGLSRAGAKGGRSRSSTISEANTPMKNPIPQPIAISEPSRTISRPVTSTTSKETPRSVSNTLYVKTEPVSSSVPVVAAQSVPSRGIADLVPLRERMAGTTTAADRSAARHRSNSLSKETPEKWRMRIWPSKALTAFCRIITRCTPPDSTVGMRLGASSHGQNHKGGKVEKVGLKPHWRMSELTKVPMTFDDAALHSSTFFLLTVEECREAVSHAEDPEAFAIADVDKKSNSNRGGNASGNGWIKGEITAIVAESAGAPLPRACDPRLGSVWVIAAAISAPITGANSANNSGKGGYGNKFGVMGCDVSGGDLMVLHSPQWSHPLLGIIQPWDPDYDIKYGINFSVNQSTYISTQQPARDGGKPGQPPLQVVNILVCVDQGDGLSGSADIGGWATQGSIVPGVGFSMTAIGNVMTYIRECQALMSLKLINKSLQNMVLTGCFSPNYTAALRAATADQSAADGTSSGYGSSTSSNQGRGRSTSMSSDSDGGIAFASHKPRADKVNRVLSPRRALMEQPINCPENVPMPLWLALRRQYNESQLRAICMVSRRFQEKEYHTGQSTTEASLSLLQGPPGTGKTRTILGIVSVFLAGALNLTAQGTTRIVAGASLYGETAGEASTKWSDEKLQRPRGGSISLTNTVNADGQSGGKRTRVLICAPSNTAVDEVVYRLITQGVLDSQGKRMNDLSVIRIGQPCRDEYQRTGVDTFGRSKHHQHLSASDENMVRIVERATLDTLVEERRRTLMASDTRAQAGATLKIADIRKQILEGADVVCSTLSGAGSQPMLEVVLRITGFKFDAVIIDEAAQAVEPSSLIPFKYNPQAVVLVGDPCQLPATVFSATAKKAGYSQSLFQRLQIAGYPVLMLETQYRMHPAIAEYPSLRYYQSRLITGSQLITSDSHKMPYHNDPSGKFRPFLFHNVPWSTETTEGTSTSNRDEARYVVDLFEELVTKYPDHRGGIGIIAPYRAQRRLLNTLFRERFGNQHQHRRGVPPIFDLDTEISTVDGFQGREKNIVIFSCVRAPTNRNHYFNTRHLHTSNSSVSLEGVAEEAEVAVEVAGREDAQLETQSNASSSSATSSTVPGASFRGIGFLKEWQRLNVAITRSRYALWIVGNSDVLSADSEWRHLVDYSKKKNSFYTAPFPETNNTSNNNQVNSGHHQGGNNNNNNQQHNGPPRGKNYHKNQQKKKNKPPPPPARPPLPTKESNVNQNHVNSTSSIPRPAEPVHTEAPRANAVNMIVSDGIVVSSTDTNRPAKRPPQPSHAPSFDPAKKPRSDGSVHASTSLNINTHANNHSSGDGAGTTTGPFSYHEVVSSYQQGPFSFAIQKPSRDFDINERNPAAINTYLPPAQAIQHPLSPQQRKVQKQLGLDAEN